MKIFSKILDKLFKRNRGLQPSQATQEMTEHSQSLTASSFKPKRPQDHPKLHTRRPQFWIAGLKTLQGFFALGIAYIFENWIYQNHSEAAKDSIANELVKTAGVALVVEGCQEFLNTMIFISTKSKSHPDQRYTAILIKEQLSKNVFNTLATGITVVAHLQSLENQLFHNISPLAFSFPTGFRPQNSGAILNYINVPITNSVIILLMIPAFIANLRELILNLKNSKLRREDPPLLKLLNGLSYTKTSYEASKFLNGYYKIELTNSTPKMILKFPAGTEMSTVINAHRDSNRLLSNYMLFGYLLSFPNKLGRYEVYKGFAQMLLNIQEAFLDQVTIQVEDTQASKQNSNSKLNQPIKSSTLLFQATPPPLALMPPSSSVSLNEAYNQASFQKNPNPNLEIKKKAECVVSTSIVEQPPKTKGPKTKGINDLAQARKRNSTPVPEASKLNSSLQKTTETKETKETKESLETEALRKDKLELITEFRCYNQVNKRIIEKEFDCLTTFLPTAKINEGDGSEKSLCWQWKDKSFKLKYEVMHGKDDNEYRGRKLRKALNVLEAAYLWGWDKTKVDAHLSQRKKDSGLEKLMFVFTERAKL